MQVSVTDAKGRLTDLVRRAEAGDEVILTRHGHAAVRLTPVKTIPNKQSRWDVMESIRLQAAGKVIDGPDAARSQDFLYDENGLPA